MVEITEVRGWHLAHLTAFGSQREEFHKRLTEAFWVEPPIACYRSITLGAARLVRLSRDQYWWIESDDMAMRRFAEDLPSSAGAVTFLSAGRVRLRLRGDSARHVLAKGVAIDLDPQQFAVGHSAQTGLHHTGIYLERVAVETFELFVQRTFATSILEWLKDASLADGVLAT